MSNGKPLIDYTNKDYASLRAALLELAAEKLPEWTDQSPNDLGVMLVELFAAMGDALFYNQDRIAAESFLDTAVERRSVVQLLRLIGYELRPALPASADLTLLFDESAAGKVVIPTGATFKTTAGAGGPPVSFQFLQKTLTKDLSSLPLGAVDAKGQLLKDEQGRLLPPPSKPGYTAYRVFRTLPVVQVDAKVTEEIVASSDGTAGQRYPLSRSPVILDTLVVSVGEGGNQVAWTRVASLLDSLNTDQHHAVRRDENGILWIELGDGTYGKIPRRGANNIRATYCVGGGIKGNVAIGAISKTVTPIEHLKAVRNEKAATGGTEPQSTQEAVVRGPRQFRSRDRAVTAADYEALAKDFGVGKAIAQNTGWNNVTLIVAPVGGGYPSDTLKDDLVAYFDRKRMMTSIVQIADPRYVNVRIDAEVYYSPQFSPTALQQQIQDVVGRLLSFDNVQFGQTLYISQIYEAIQDIGGVIGANIRTFARVDDPRSPPLVDSLPGNGQLVFSAALGEIPQWTSFERTSFDVNDGKNTLKLTPRSGTFDG